MALFYFSPMHSPYHMDEKAKVIFKAHSFSNTVDGANSLLERLNPYTSELEIILSALLATSKDMLQRNLKMSLR